MVCITVFWIVLCMVFEKCSSQGGFFGPVSGFGGLTRYGSVSDFGLRGNGVGFAGALWTGCAGGMAHAGQRCGGGCACNSGYSCVTSICTITPPPEPPAQLIPIQINVPLTVYVELGNQCSNPQQCTTGAVCAQSTCQCGGGYYQEGSYCRRKKVQQHQAVLKKSVSHL